MRIKRSFKEFPVLFLKLCLYDILFKGHICGALNQNFKLQYITCPDPGFVRNANRFSFDGRPSFKKDSFQVNEVVKYICQRNFILNGPSSIVCLGSGSWSARVPRCMPPNQRMQLVAKTCQDPGFVSHANRFSGDGRPSLKNTFQVNEILIYRCRRNFVLKGPSYIRCLESGFWSAEVPRCSRYKQRLRIPSRTPTCSDPGFVQNARRVTEIGRSLLRKREFQTNETLLFECRKDFFLDGPSKITCLPSGSWSAPLPNCKPQRRTCPNPGFFKNTIRVDVEYKKDLVFNFKNENLCYTEPNSGSIETKHCISRGPGLDALPTCLLRSKSMETCCYDLAYLLNVNITQVREDRVCPTYYPEDIIEFSCKAADQNLLGKSLLTCMPSGKWSDLVPFCIDYLYSLEKEMEDMTYDDICPEISVPRTFIEVTSTAKAHKRNLEEQSTQLPILETETRGMTYGQKLFFRNQFPWLVAISNLTKYGQFDIICSATLLNRNTVVTAAHCLTNLELNKTRLYFGKYFRSNSEDEAIVQVAMPTLFIVHVNYSADTYDSDIALIKFHPPVTYTKFVHQACISLPTTPLSERDFNDTYFGVLAGWGLTEKHLYSQVPLFAWIPIVPSEICLNAFKQLERNVTLTSNMFCAGGKKGSIGPCLADSGSGLFFPKNDRRSLVLVGIVSFGAYPECGLTNRYDFFTNVANFVPWIQKHI